MDHLDRLIADANFDENGDAELGTYSLHRDDTGFVEIYQWVDNRPVHQATRKEA